MTEQTNTRVIEIDEAGVVVRSATLVDLTGQ
jgi:hypothetical protein